MIILLVILKIILLHLAVDYNQLFIYQKILACQQAKYSEQVAINNQLEQLVTKVFNPQDSIGFIPDQPSNDGVSDSNGLKQPSNDGAADSNGLNQRSDSTSGSIRGIYIYPIIINNNRYGYWGQRGILSKSLHLDDKIKIITPNQQLGTDKFKQISHGSILSFCGEMHNHY
jgi:hypothetical protein